MSTIGTNLILYTGLPLDRNYENTLYFASEAAQRTFFQSTAVTLGYVNGDYSPLTYQRVNANRIKVQISEDTALHVNYLAFRNSTFSTKWFYAFVDEVNYINDNVYEIVYTLDYIQTYLFSDCTLLESFIEREHSATDDPGDNILPEPVQPKEIIPFSEDDFFIVPSGETGHAFSGKWALVCFMLPSFNSVADLNFCAFGVNNYPSELAACNVYGWEDIFSTTVDSQNKTPMDHFKDFILYHQADASGILCMYVVPNELITGSLSVDNEYNQIISRYADHTITRPTALTATGYVPKNKKLLTYPYSFFTVNSGESEMDLRYEFFRTGNIQNSCTLTLYAQISLTPTMAISPLGYNQGYVSGYHAMNINENFLLAYNRFPMVAFPVDTFMAWLAQTGSSNILRSIGNIFGATAGGFTLGGFAGAGLAGAGATLGSAVNLFTTGLEKSKSSDTAVGNNAGYFLNDIGLAGFRIQRKCVDRPEAERIDDFFSLYGYACNQVKTPVLNVRPHWTYVKTAGLQITGSCPHGAIERIKNIFDNGIRFWNNPQEIGDYTLDNRPL